MESKLVSNDLYIKVGPDMVWPNPSSDRLSNIEWRMRHAQDSLSVGDLMLAASVIDAYKELVLRKPQNNRNAVCSAITNATKVG